VTVNEDSGYGLLGCCSMDTKFWKKMLPPPAQSQRVGYKYGRLHVQVKWKIHTGWQENRTQYRPIKMVHR
jgi:hypothetical protein